jgi:GT2 family glycosyltransferase
LEYTKLCLDSITKVTAYPNYEIIIVDNNSSDNTKEYLETFKNNNPSKVKVILNETNLGFAGGNNVGIRAALGDYIMLLNNDTIVTRGWLTNLLKHLEQNPDLAMVGPVTNSIGNEARIIVNYSNMQELESFAQEYTFSHQNELVHDPNVLALFCTLIRKEVFQDERLDENFGIGMFEDDDLSYRVKYDGWRIAIAEDSFVHHFQRVSFKTLGETKESELFNQNKSYFEQKWNTIWQVHTLRDGILLNSNSESTNLNGFLCE